MAENTDSLRHYIEDFTLVLEYMGTPRTASRVLAYLMVCDPPHQTMNDLMDNLQISKSSASSATITLIQYKLVERISLPGERRDYYRVIEGIWSKLIYSRFEEVRKLREMAEKGLRILDGESASHTDRLMDMLHLCQFIESEMPKLIERWESSNKGENPA